MAMSVRLPDGTVIDNVPDGTSKEEIAAKLAGRYGFPDDPNEPTQAASVAIEAVSEVPQFEPMTMIKNIPGSAYNYGADMANAVLNPIDTATAVWNLVQGIGDKAGLDLNGKNEEIYAEAMWRQIKKRYGSMDNFITTVNEDPVGVLADVTGFVTGGSAAAAKLLGSTSRAGKVAANIKKLASAGDPWNLATNTTKAGVGKAVSAGLPERWYEEVVKFSNAKLTPKERSKLYQTALDNKIEPTPRGVDKLNHTIEALSAQIDEIISTADNADTRIPARTVLRHMDDLKKGKGGFKMDAKADVQAIDGAIEQFNGLLDDMGRDYVTVRELQDFKTDRYGNINFARKNQAGSRIGEDIDKTLARGAKEAIEEVDPRVKDINALEGDLLELKPHLERASGRIGNRNMTGLQTPMIATAGGQMAGPEGAAITGALSFIFSPQNKAKLAIALHHLKKGDVGWLNNNVTAQEARYISMLAGRTEEELRDMGLLYEAEQEIEDSPN